MARLIVEAISAEVKEDIPHTFRLWVSVSRADTGEPVQNLKGSNFRVTSMPGALQPTGAVTVKEEALWAGTDVGSGCYLILVHIQWPEPGFVFKVGIQALVFSSSPVVFAPGSGIGKIVQDQGQTILDVKSLD